MSELERFSSAINDFRQARSRANMRRILARISGQPTELLPFDEVRRKLRGLGGVERGLQDIPLDSIVGSAGRYTDFTRDFLPRASVIGERWARVKVAMTEQTGLPPIEVYKIGEVYFVKDGNHRVSVARQLGATHIQAYVTEIHTRVSLTPDIQPDDLIIKEEYVDFLERTRLDKLRSQADLTVTVPGKYEDIIEHINVHRYYMGIDLQREISYDEAVAHWYDTVYLPVVEIIRQQGLLDSFPNRTEADLYLWIAEHRAALEDELGWSIKTEVAATNLIDQFSPKPTRMIARLGEKFLNTITLARLEGGPPPGNWRKEKLTVRNEDNLFKDILVPVNGEASGWFALEQALILAQREGAALHGLHVVSNEKQAESQPALEVKNEFDRRCARAGISGRLVISTGPVPHEICRRAHWADLVITNLAFPPAAQPFSRLSSGFRELIHRCPAPLLAVPQVSTPMQSALLAYDGSPKSEEALFVATYIAAKWQVPLVLLCVQDNARVTQQTLDHGREYLESHGVTATILLEKGPFAETILKVGEAYGCDFFIMGGYGLSPVVEVVLGSVVDQVLRESRKPILICR